MGDRLGTRGAVGDTSFLLGTTDGSAIYKNWICITPHNFAKIDQAVKTPVLILDKSCQNFQEPPNSVDVKCKKEF